MHGILSGQEGAAGAALCYSCIDKTKTTWKETECMWKMERIWIPGVLSDAGYLISGNAMVKKVEKKQVMTLDLKAPYVACKGDALYS